MASKEPSKKAAPAPKAAPAAKQNPFTRKPAETEAKVAPAAKAVKKAPASSAPKAEVKAEPAPKPAKNPFTAKRDTKQAPLHAAPLPEPPTPKAKSFSFYAEDMERLNQLRDQLVPRSSKRVSDSVVVRVALAYLEEHLKSKDGSAQFERQLREMLLRQS